MKTSDHITALVQHFTCAFIDALRNGGQPVRDHLLHCRCTITDTPRTAPTVEFDMPGLMDAVWRDGCARGLDLPSNSRWDRDFREFRHLLMQPGSQRELAQRGYSIHPGPGNTRALDRRYKLAAIQTQ